MISTMSQVIISDIVIIKQNSEVSFCLLSGIL